ncbi:hypothetical protein SAMN05216420_10426 [Nitrosospira sp. Nl5]|uniref:hypothetical protein n=1 Tax=Nitrosospira sp. Nl5 TaxID=200120 RepID=UPI00088CA2AF|nr:hypothetical protein [Nitrosospira sp. Nl5]SCY26064.1 hypothetical protein SAMN05216420_10426 [Nitrosospira sp. Nl5]
MPQVKYIGNCAKTDSVNGVGLCWEPGQIRNVTAEVAERLLAFRDTWAKEARGKAAHAEPIGLAPAEKPVEEPLPVVDFHAMDKKTLIEFAERQYNERLDKRQDEDTLRHKVVALFSRHEMPL